MALIPLIAVSVTRIASVGLNRTLFDSAAFALSLLSFIVILFQQAMQSQRIAKEPMFFVMLVIFLISFAILGGVQTQRQDARINDLLQTSKTSVRVMESLAPASSLPAHEVADAMNAQERAIRNLDKERSGPSPLLVASFLLAVFVVAYCAKVWSRT
ncbi:MAG: hypothetical protein LC808_39735 [Actinobacteria bacterium]|nr:hypothetical protein [Actinomycetota bacterium]